MKTITTIALFLFLTGCGYTMKLGKKCTPNHDEWSYVWFIEKDGINVSRENCTR
jgi:outer membrane lipopolysaccharide assembly protein LptE/RlpB